MQTVIVESPAKAKTIGAYLGGDYQVLASYGHVRDLPAKDGSVDPDADFAMSWEVDAAAKKRIREIADKVSRSERLILATDPDREGEAISWHLLEALKATRKLPTDVKVDRVAFNSVTKAAVNEAIQKPRSIDMELVEAYLARRALDYLVGFSLSPILWRKLPGARSAGRVQSVALRLIVDRETEIEEFSPREYWTVNAQAKGKAQTKFVAHLTHLSGKKLDKYGLPDKESAERALAAVKKGNFVASNIESKPLKRNPPAPFITSTLQQEASRKLSMGAKQAMRIAQQLYEGVDIGGETVGLITYMRTDGVDMAPEAISQSRGFIAGEFGDDYVPQKPRIYKSKAKNAQEAHECVRPTDFRRTPDKLKFLNKDLLDLYSLIWRRALASQMASADLQRTTILVEDADAGTILRASGQVVLFDGFQRLYMEGKHVEGDGKDGVLPKVARGESLLLSEVESVQSFTQPPPRYSEASLVQKMEELAIGRPSTYASILSVIQDRGYVRKEKGRFHPEDKGRLVTVFLANFFGRYVEYDFTADLEKQLDEISSGALKWKKVLADFWQDFSKNVGQAQELSISDIMQKIDDALASHLFPEREDGSDPRACQNCDDGRLALKRGKFGAFIGCSNYPDCRFTRPFEVAATEKAQSTPQSQERLLGPDKNGRDVVLKYGRFGPYVERQEEGSKKPARASVPKDIAPDDINIETALALLALPRTIGQHPEDGEDIYAGIGRYGPYVRHGRSYASLSSTEEALTIGINRAVAVLAEKKQASVTASRQRKPALREFDPHPEDGKPVSLLEGRYGPYIKWGKINASLPKGSDPQEFTQEQALELLSRRQKKKRKS